MTNERILIARKKAGLTQQQLADLIGVKRAVISKYETGAIEPSIPQLKKIASALDVALPYLLDMVDDPHNSSFHSVALDLALKGQSAINKKTRGPISHAELPVHVRGRINCIKRAESSLLRTVHEICGMNEFSISEDLKNDTLNVKWDARKIDIIREYLEDSSVILKKMFAQLQEEPERDKEDPEAPAPETK